MQELIIDFKREEQQKRTRCIRILEKFVSRIYALLYNKVDTTKDEYLERVKKLSSTLKACDEVDIFSEHLRSLRSLVEKMLQLSQSDESIDNIKIEIRDILNKTEQQRNAKKYKREKKPRKNQDYD